MTTLHRARVILALLCLVMAASCSLYDALALPWLLDSDVLCDEYRRLDDELREQCGIAVADREQQCAERNGCLGSTVALDCGAERSEWVRCFQLDATVGDCEQYGGAAPDWCAAEREAYAACVGDRRSCGDEAPGTCRLDQTAGIGGIDVSYLAPATDGALFAWGEDDTFRIFDVQDGQLQTRFAKEDVGWDVVALATDASRGDDLAYVLDGSQSEVIVVQAAAALELGRSEALFTTGFGTAMAVADGIVYVGSSAGELVVLDFSASALPTEVGRVFGDGFITAIDVSIEAALVYVGTEGSGVHAYDVRARADPELRYHVDLFEPVVGLRAAGETVEIATEREVMQASLTFRGSMAFTVDGAAARGRLMAASSAGLVVVAEDDAGGCWLLPYSRVAGGLEPLSETEIDGCPLAMAFVPGSELAVLSFGNGQVAGYETAHCW